MNILMISALDIWSMGKKSGAQSLYETIKGYTNHGDNIFFLTDKSGKSFKTNLKLKNFHYYTFALNIDINKMKQRILKSTFHKLRWFLFQIFVLFYGVWCVKKNQIDVIYSYEIFGMPSGMILKLIFNKPLIARFQGTILKSKLDNPLNLIFYIEHTIAFFLSKYSDIVIMTNDGTQGDKVMEYFKVPEDKIRFWFNGIDLPKEIKASDFIKINGAKVELKNKKVIVTLSRLASWKRVDRIISVMPCIVSRVKNVILIIIGDGEEKEILVKMTKKLNIEEYVKFVGSQQHSKALEILKRADMFVSLYDLSNVGNPLLESMKLGRCILTLNNGDTGSIIKNNYNGILLEYDDLNDLCKYVVNVLNDSKKIKYLGNNALRFAKENFFSWEKRMLMEINDVEKIFK